MNPDERARNSAPDSQVESKQSPRAFASVSAEAPLATIASDRMYQLAAMTAGIFLLATLL